MDFGWLTWLCDGVILIGAVILAFDRIFKPIGIFKKKADKSFEEKVSETLIKVMPQILEQHYEIIKERLVQEIKDSVITQINDELTQVDLLKQQYDILVLTAKDVLREKIMKIYNDYRREKELPIAKKEQLDQYYNDYKKLKGNSYIDKYYNRMKRWIVIDEDEELEEDK